MLVRSLSGKDPLEEGTATHYSILASRIRESHTALASIYIHSAKKIHPTLGCGMG